MNTKDLQQKIQQLKDIQKATFISLKATGDDRNSDISIEANQNGILALCNQLLISIDSEHLEKDAFYQLPDSLFDDSDIWITEIRIREGNQNPEPIKESILTKTGCILAAIFTGVVLITGIVTVFSWLVNLF